MRYKQGRFKGYFGDGFVEVYRVVGIWAVGMLFRVIF